MGHHLICNRDGSPPDTITSRVYPDPSGWLLFSADRVANARGCTARLQIGVSGVDRYVPFYISQKLIFKKK